MPIDYAALAEQARQQTPDYNALAAQARGETQPSTISAVSTSEPGTYAGGFVKGLKDYAREIPGRAIDAVKQEGSAVLNAMNPISMARDLVGAVNSKQQREDDFIAGKPQGTTLGDIVKDPSGTAQAFAQAAPTVAGNVMGGMLTGRLVQAAGAGLRYMAPKAMDAGLWRTAAQRLDFPNTPQRLVDEGIVPSKAQAELTATEGRVNAATAAADARRPNLGAPINPVDPNQIASQAQDFAFKEGKVGGLGNVPGPEAAELDQLGNNYLAQNTRNRSLGETIDQKRAYAARSKYSNRPNAKTQTGEEVNFNKGVAGANRQAAIAAAPELEGELSREQDLIGAVHANALADAKGTPLVSAGMPRKMLLRPDPMGYAAIGGDRLGQALSSADALRLAILARLRASEPSQDAQGR